MVAAGCSGGGSDKDPGALPDGPTLLSLAVYGPPQVVTAYSDIAATYTTEHPNTSISIEPYATAAEAQVAIERQVAAGTAPDLFLAPVAALPGLEKAKAIQPVGEKLLDRDVDFGDGYQRYALESFSSENSLQCMPISSSPMVVYYNSDLVDLTALNSDVEEEVTQETGWTFAQFELAAQAPRAAGVRGIYIEPSLTQLAPFIFSGGGKLLDNDKDPTRLSLSDGSTKDALQKVLPLFRDPLVTFSQQEIETASAVKRFKAGQLAMLLGFRSLTPELRAAKKLHFDVMPIPKVGAEATIGDTSGLCMSADSTQVDQAADFLAYVVSKDAMSRLAATGFIVPTNNDVAHQDTFLQAAQQPVHATVFTEQVRSIKAMPSAAAWPEVVQATVPLLSKLLYDPLIQSLEDRLNEIDDLSEPLFSSADDAPTPAS